MAVTLQKILVAFCLCVLICASVSHGYGMYGRYGRYGRYGGPGFNPNGRLTQYCGLFTWEKIDEGYGACNMKVLKEVYDKDKDLYHDGYMRQLFRRARHGMLCYAEGPRVVNVRGACDAMELACRPYAPRTVDNCWSIRVAPPNPPPAGPAATPQPNPPAAGPGGWGI
eukprot:XP_011672109.1 PREDICTED: uncharacterized protein LOC105442048 [Strongylocentrotus purpuratus]